MFQQATLQYRVAELRQADLLAGAATRRLLAEARTNSGGRKSPAAWLGAALVGIGTRLQGTYGDRPTASIGSLGATR